MEEYSQFVAMIRKFSAEDMTFEEAVEQAVDVCISKGILSDILRKNKSEVIDMILTEYNEEEFREFLKEESWNEGKIEGVIKTCMDFDISKEITLEKIMKDFSLSEKDAKQYLDKYWK